MMSKPIRSSSRRVRLAVGERCDFLIELLERVDERSAAAGDHPLLDCRSRRRERVFDAVLLLFELGLGRSTDLDDRNAAGELGKTLLQLLAVEVAIGLLDLPLDHLDAALDRVGLTVAVDDRGLFLRDLDRLGLTEQIRRDLVELEAKLFADRRSPPVRVAMSLSISLRRSPKPGALTRDGRERSAQLVDDQRRERFAFDVFRDDEQRLLDLHDLLEQRQDVGDRRDLALGDEDVRIVERRLPSARSR